MKNNRTFTITTIIMTITTINGAGLVRNKQDQENPHSV